MRDGREVEGRGHTLFFGCVASRWRQFPLSFTDVSTVLQSVLCVCVELKVRTVRGVYSVIFLVYGLELMNESNVI